MHPSKSLTLGCLMLLAGNALGAASVDLSISATTHPAACDIRLDNGGKVDYGTLHHGDLNPDSSRETLLPARTIGWQINCGYAVPIALQWTDNHRARYRSGGGIRQLLRAVVVDHPHRTARQPGPYAGDPAGRQCHC